MKALKGFKRTKKAKSLTKPMKIADLALEDLYEDADQSWQYRAKKLQIRRWRALKRSMKADRYAIR